MLRIQVALILLLALPASASEPAAVAAPDASGAAIKAAIGRDWTTRTDASGGVMLESPAYAMHSGTGCVIHRLYFPAHDGRPSPGDMIASEEYHVFASGEACTAVDRERFFGIEPGNDVARLLDFGRRLATGPRAGKDRISTDALAKVAPCFSAEAMTTTHIARAHSWRPEGGRQDRYQASIECKALEEQGQIVATGTRGEEAIAWEFRRWDQQAVDAAP